MFYRLLTRLASQILLGLAAFVWATIAAFDTGRGSLRIGFAVAAHPADPDTAWFVPGVKDECRVPVDGRLVVTRTRDGAASFAALAGGLPTGPSYDLVYRHALAVDEDQRGLGIGKRLVAGAERWFAERGVTRLELTSAEQRSDTHRFLRAVGFREKRLRMVKDRH